MISIVLADDDADDQQFVKEAFEESRLSNPLICVQDGEELMKYLLHQPPYADPERYPRPGLILLDLNMPKKDGRQALKEIKSHPDLRRIPVVILTTSQSDQDVFRSYDSGANSFIVKPVTFESLVGVIKELGKYWLEIVELPESDEGE